MLPTGTVIANPGGNPTLALDTVTISGIDYRHGHPHKGTWDAATSYNIGDIVEVGAYPNGILLDGATRCQFRAGDAHRGRTQARTGGERPAMASIEAMSRMTTPCTAFTRAIIGWARTTISTLQQKKLELPRPTHSRAPAGQPESLV